MTLSPRSSGSDGFICNLTQPFGSVTERDGVRDALASKGMGASVGSCSLPTRVALVEIGS